MVERYAKQSASIRLFTIDEMFGGWRNAQKAHFSEGGSFDQIFFFDKTFPTTLFETKLD